MPNPIARIEVALGELTFAFEDTAFNMDAFGGEGGWTDLTPDVSLRAGESVTWSRGMADNRPLTRIASTGMLTFALRNDAGATFAQSGRPAPYSMNSPYVLPGWTYGIPVRLVANYAGTDHVLFVGKLRSVNPDPNIYGPKRAVCIAQDCMGDLSDYDVVSVPPQLNKSEADLIDAIIAAIPATGQPIATDIDTGLDTYPYALDDIGGGVKAMTPLSDVVISAQGWLYPKANGHLVYENRHSREVKSPVATFADDGSGDARMDSLVVPSDLQNVYNRVRVTAHPRKIDASATTVLCAIQGSILIPAGGSVTTWLSYVSPDNVLQLIGGTAFVLVGSTDGYSGGLTATTDFLAFANSDGTGTNLTSNIAIAAVCFAADAKLTIANSGGTNAYLTFCQVRGKGIYDTTPTTVESYTAEDYGERPLDIDLRYQNDLSVSQDMADFVNSQYRLFSNQINVLGVTGEDNASILQCLTREIGDVVVVWETMTGMQGIQAVIHGVSGSLLPGGLIHIDWTMAPFVESGTWIFDDATKGLLDSGTVFGFA